MWPLRREEAKQAVDVTPPPPITPVDREEQRRYIEKHEKYAKPFFAMSNDAVRLGSEYAKFALTYLILGNSGGLAALLAVFPFMRDSNQLWLSQQLPVAMCFAFGLLLAVAIAPIAFDHYISTSRAIWAHGQMAELWVQVTEITLSPTQVSAHQARIGADEAKARRRMAITYRLAFGLFAASGVCWVAGAFLLTKSVINR